MTGVTIFRRRKDVKKKCSPRYEKSSRRTAFNKSFPPVPITIRLQRFGLPIAGGATITLGGGGTLTIPSNTTLQGLTTGSGATLTNLTSVTPTQHFSLAPAQAAR